MKKQDHKNKRKFDYDEREGGHTYKRLRTEQQRKAHNALDKVLKQKRFNFRQFEDDVGYL